MTRANDGTDDDGTRRDDATTDDATRAVEEKRRRARPSGETDDRGERGAHDAGVARGHRGGHGEKG